jgi:hypothetical protein
MRKTRGTLLVLLLVGLSAVFTFAQGAATVETSIDIIVSPDVLAIKLDGSQPIAISGLTLEVDGELYSLNLYPGFQGLNFDNISLPICFVLRVQFSSTPLTIECAELGNRIFTVTLPAADVFWFDPTLNALLPINVLDNSTLLQNCSAGARCTFTFSAPAAVTPTPLPTISLDCVISDTLNMFSTVDTDGDGYSDFEELCILQTSPDEPNFDTDDDGVLDEIEEWMRSINPNWAEVNIANEDRDQDWLFDTVELDNGTDPNEIDTDGDLVSDFLEFYWLGTNPTENDLRDENGDGFPDVMSRYFPPSAAPDACRLLVTLTIDELYVVDPEEANGFDIIPGDEPEMTYGLDIEGEIVDNRYRQQWSASGVMGGDRLRNFPQIPARAMSCGQTAVVYVRLIESDAPFGGVATLGEANTPIPLIFHRVPIAWVGQAGSEIIFAGIVEDGAYDYRLRYTLIVEPQL